jgi:hypothetical protein
VLVATPKAKMGMDMNMGMGMDMSSDSAAFVDTNSSMARSYWYIIAAVLGFTALLRIFQIAETRTRLVAPLPLPFTATRTVKQRWEPPSD